MKIDFFARRSHYFDHMLPVWRELEAERGEFFVSKELVGYAEERGVSPAPLSLSTATSPHLPNTKMGGERAMMVCAYGDLGAAYWADRSRKFVFMEHGVGITYGGHPGYAGGKGMRQKVDLFLAPNEIVRAKTAKAIPDVKQVVIGTPKLDRFLTTKGTKEHEGKPVVCISFHWSGERIEPEAGNAFQHYQKMLPILAHWTGFKLIGHGHPRGMDSFARVYEKLGIEVVRDFDEVMERADVYVVDNSSTLYEFCVTGKPVVIMNAPAYRRKVHWGIRFWDYTDVGPMIDGPEELLGAILHALDCPEVWQEARERAVRDLYPHLGESAKVAANAIREWLGSFS